MDAGFPVKLFPVGRRNDPRPALVRAFSSAGRASRLHRECHRFDPGRAHQMRNPFMRSSRSRERVSLFSDEVEGQLGRGKPVLSSISMDGMPKLVCASEFLPKRRSCGIRFHGPSSFPHAILAGRPRKSVLLHFLRQVPYFCFVTKYYLAILKQSENFTPIVGSQL